MDYKEFLKTKDLKFENAGFDIDRKEVNKAAFEFQIDIIKCAVKKGRYAVFADCGMGKTLIQLEYARLVHERTGKDILILAPLSVSVQTKREGEKFGIDVNICRNQGDVKAGINITNYEMLEHFKPEHFGGIVLDESSILKAYTSKTKQQIIDAFRDTPYKLACTATPSPNDHVELGNHSEFLGVMDRTEMLAMYFVNDMQTTQKWRLKGHAEKAFWEWVASWSVVIRNPSDLGYKMAGYDLPKLNIIEHLIESELGEFELVPKLAETLTERREARKESMDKRVMETAKLVNSSNEQWCVWCDYNDESEKLKKAITDCVEVKGSDTAEHKEVSGLEFANGNIHALVSKPSIYGFGMNWQSCHNVAFCGLSDSYEKFYQAVRRCYRFGQEHEVNVHIFISEKEKNVLDNIKRKQSQADNMSEKMVMLTKEVVISEIKSTKRIKTEYKPLVEIEEPKWLKGA